MTLTLERMTALRESALALNECIREAGPAGVPAGHLYAAVMGHMSLDTFQVLIRALKEVGLIKEQFHLLTAVEESPDARRSKFEQS